MSLEVIIGCMFSGKSSTLIRKVARLRAIDKKCVFVNHTFDSRCGEEVKTHEGIRYNAVKCDKMAEFTNWEEYDVIGIDEGQFFQDIVHYVEKYLLHGVVVIVAGLSGDFNLKPFINVCELMSLANDVTYTKALCVHCKDGTPATFSKRLINDNKRILTGADDTYEPVCRVHFSEKNT